MEKKDKNINHSLLKNIKKRKDKALVNEEIIKKNGTD